MTQRTDTYDDEQWQLVPKKLTPEMTSVIYGPRYVADALFSKFLAAAPTPPASAHSVEPVAWFEAEQSAMNVPLRDLINSMIHSTRWHMQSARPVTNNPVWALYTTPPSAEGARDAALEEAARAVNPHNDEWTTGAMNARVIRALKSKKEA